MRMMPTRPLATPTCFLGHEVGHEALVGALREVGTELETDEEQRVEDQQAGRAERFAVPARGLGHGDEREPPMKMRSNVVPVMM